MASHTFQLATRWAEISAKSIMCVLDKSNTHIATLWYLVFLWLTTSSRQLEIILVAKLAKSSSLLLLFSRPIIFLFLELSQWFQHQSNCVKFWSTSMKIISTVLWTTAKIWSQIGRHFDKWYQSAWNWIAHVHMCLRIRLVAMKVLVMLDHKHINNICKRIHIYKNVQSNKNYTIYTDNKNNKIITVTIIL